MPSRLLIYPILAGLLSCGIAHTAGTLPALSSGKENNVVMTPVNSNAAVIAFKHGQWPNVYWSSGETPWNWTKTPTLAFDIANLGKKDIAFNVRIDDDPKADGVHHCRTVSAAIGAGASGKFFINLSAPDSKAKMGMNAGPPPSGISGMQAMTGNGEIDISHIVAFQIFLDRAEKTETLRLSRMRLLPAIPATALYSKIVDRFGQFSRADWPGKLHSQSEFAKRSDAEKKEWAAHPAPPDRDAYGGWAKGPKLPASGFFSTTKRDGRWWLVDPEGRLFLSFGIDTLGMDEGTIIHPRDEMFSWLPGPSDPLAKFYGEANVLYGPYKSGKTYDFYKANLERKYGANYPDAWRKATAARLKSWGFDTIGNWSDETLEAMDRVPYAASLGVGGGHAQISSGSDYWGRMHDPFDPKFAADCDASFREKATRFKSDPWCVGYFVDNELSWAGGDVDGGRYGLAYGTLSAPADQPAKRAFLAQLKAKYSDIERLDAAWGADLKSWDDLSAPFAASRTPNAAQKDDMRDFVYAFALKYFTVVKDSLKKFDPNHLYLGCRFAWYGEDAVLAAGKVCDVVSFNIYRKGIDATTAALAHRLNKPCIIGEFHFGALDRGSFHAGLVPTPDQAARARCFRDYVESVVDNPDFVGAHWFQYKDEPLTGRSFDGENYNIGFVSVTDAPYPEMVRSARAVFGEMYPRRAAKSK